MIVWIKNESFVFPQHLLSTKAEISKHNLIKPNSITSSTDYMCGCRDSAALLTTVITLSPEHSSRIRAKPVTVVFQHEHGTSGVFYQSSLRTYSQPVPTFAVEEFWGTGRYSLLVGWQKDEVLLYLVVELVSSVINILSIICGCSRFKSHWKLNGAEPLWIQ